MNETEKIPELEDSGSDGSQIEAVSDITLVEPTPLLAKTIEGLSSNNTRALGGEVASAFMRVATQQIEASLREAKAQVGTLQKENKELQNNTTTLMVNSSRLEERISAFRAIRHLRNFGIVVGTTLLAIGIQLFQIQKNTYGSISIIIGVLLLVLSWFTAPKGGQK